jgi:hypothetical protein
MAMGNWRIANDESCALALLEWLSAKTGNSDWRLAISDW